MFKKGLALFLGAGLLCSVLFLATTPARAAVELTYSIFFPASHRNSILAAEWDKVVTFSARAKEQVKAGEHAAIAWVSGAGPGAERVEAPPATTALRKAIAHASGYRRPAFAVRNGRD